jgi:hypothetical protein
VVVVTVEASETESRTGTSQSSAPATSAASGARREVIGLGWVYALFTVLIGIAVGGIL